jgi:hypothetical protein
LLYNAAEETIRKILLQESKCSFQIKHNPLCSERITSSVINKREIFPGAAWIYSADRFLGMYEQVSCQVLFSSDGAENRCSHITLCY